MSGTRRPHSFPIQGTPTFEAKFDGFRALAYVDDGHCELVSRKGHVYRRFADLCQGIAADLKAHQCILDGEIVCLDNSEKT